MRLEALHVNLEVVIAGHHRPAAIADHPRIECRPGVQAEHRIHRVTLEQTLVQHQPRAAFLALRRAFLRRLKDQQHRARQLTAHTGQNLGGRQQNRDMGIVTAGVHDAGLLVVECRCHERSKWQTGRLGYRQRIDIGA